MPYAIILESGGDDSAERYDIACAAPAALLALEGEQQDTSSLSSHVAKLIERHTSNTATGAQSTENNSTQHSPFISGAVGLINYESAAQWSLRKASRNSSENTRQQLSEHNEDANTSAREPEFNSFIGIFQWALIRDHLTSTAWLTADNKLPEAQWLQLCQLLNASTNQKAEKKSPKECNDNELTLLDDWQSSMNYPTYLKQFDHVKRYIDAGDCYQINLTRQFSNRYMGNEWAAYRTLRERAPAPFSCYLHTPHATVVSCSPERFIKIRDGHVASFPIKGTRPKKSSDCEDAQQLADLTASNKDRAENLMIVDLIRNDIGRFCKTGSITVPELFRTRTYSNVHHLVSQVNGQIERGDVKASLELFFGCLPGGSVTGAPKRRAMEIIDQLEPHRRSIYCGSVFYINNNGDLDSNILIRSLLFNPDSSQDPTQTANTFTAGENTVGKVYCWGGGGIVADSVAEQEFAESEYKVANLLNALTKKER